MAESADTPGPAFSGRNRSLLEAVDRGDSEYVRRLLQDQSLDVNAAEPGTGFTALHMAAARNAIAVLRFLVSTGRCDLGAKDAKGRTAATVAVTLGRNPAVGRYLFDLQHGNVVVTEWASRRRGGQRSKPGENTKSD